MEFIEEKAFDRRPYDQLVRRIHYDDRDASSYHNMLDFLWNYVIRTESISDRAGLYEEYSHWNGQLIDHCYYHPHDLPYEKIQRAFQTLVCLLAGDPEEGERQLSLIGRETFMTDGLSPKMVMKQDGSVYRPMARLFLIYNFARYYRHFGMTAEKEALMESYPYAFREFGDQDHEGHDLFLKEQMEEGLDILYYPVYSRVYRQQWKSPDFFLFYDAGRQIPIKMCLS